VKSAARPSSSGPRVAGFLGDGSEWSRARGRWFGGDWFGDLRRGCGDGEGCVGLAVGVAGPRGDRDALALGLDALLGDRGEQLDEQAGGGSLARGGAGVEGAVVGAAVGEHDVEGDVGERGDDLDERAAGHILRGVVADGEVGAAAGQGGAQGRGVEAVGAEHDGVDGGVLRVRVDGGVVRWFGVRVHGRRRRGRRRGEEGDAEEHAQRRGASHTRPPG
jgi:hypothetical protein